MTLDSLDAKRMRRRMISTWPARVALRAMLGATWRRNEDLVVPMFHRTLDADRFREQIETLVSGRTPVAGADVVAAIEGGANLPRRPLWITFDDGYGDFAELAWPVLQRLGLPVTQFVPTGFIGQRPCDFWWERLATAFLCTRCSHLELPDAAGRWRPASLAGSGRARAFKRARTLVKSRAHLEGMALAERIIVELGREGESELAAQPPRTLTWDEIEGLQRQGVEFAGHTRLHPMLDQIEPERVAGEVQAGFDDLSERLGSALPVLAYPSGHFNDEVVRETKKTTARAAVTTDEGTNCLERVDAFRLRRVAIGPQASAPAVRLRLLLALRRRSAS